MIKKLLILLFLFFSISVLFYFSDYSKEFGLNWKEYKYENGLITLKFPTVPLHESKYSNTNIWVAPKKDASSGNMIIQEAETDKILRAQYENGYIKDGYRNNQNLQEYFYSCIQNRKICFNVKFTYTDTLKVGTSYFNDSNESQKEDILISSRNNKINPGEELIASEFINYKNNIGIKYELRRKIKNSSGQEEYQYASFISYLIGKNIYNFYVESAQKNDLMKDIFFKNIRINK